MGRAILEHTADEVRVEAPTEVLSSSIDEFRNLVLGAVEQQPRRLLVDCSGVRIICSEGLGVLVAAMVEQREAGREMCLLRPPPLLRDLLNRTRLDVILAICD